MKMISYILLSVTLPLLLWIKTCFGSDYISLVMPPVLSDFNRFYSCVMDNLGPEPHRGFSTRYDHRILGDPVAEKRLFWNDIEINYRWSEKSKEKINPVLRKACMELSEIKRKKMERIEKERLRKENDDVNTILKSVNNYNIESSNENKK